MRQQDAQFESGRREVAELGVLQTQGGRHEVEELEHCGPLARVFEHLQKAREGFARGGRLLRKNGKIIIEAVLQNYSEPTSSARPKKEFPSS